jgi:ribonucleoside-diphosphate reductase alpha chain
VRVPTREEQEATPPKAIRHKLPSERASITHKFEIAGHEGYITVGLYGDKRTPGEIFIRMAKEGSTVSGLMDSFATAVSLALQHGVPVKLLCDKFSHTRFEPSGWTGTEFGYAKSIMDYIFRWIELRFLPGQQYPLPFQDTKPLVTDAPLPLDQRSVQPVAATYTVAPGDDRSAAESIGSELKLADRGIYHTADAMKELVDMGDAPSCHTCGAIMTRNGSCYRCQSCGSTSGCS